MPRNYDALFQNGACIVCQQPRTEAGYVAHAEHHLSTCECVVLSEIVDGKIIERVVPTESVALTDSPAPEVTVYGRKPDQKLLALARAALKRSQKEKA